LSYFANSFAQRDYHLTPSGAMHDRSRRLPWWLWAFRRISTRRIDWKTPGGAGIWLPHHGAFRQATQDWALCVSSLTFRFTASLCPTYLLNHQSRLRPGHLRTSDSSFAWCSTSDHSL